jgi:hypothetical protein
MAKTATHKTKKSTTKKTKWTKKKSLKKSNNSQTRNSLRSLRSNGSNRIMHVFRGGSGYVSNSFTGGVLADTTNMYKLNPNIGSSSDPSIPQTSNGGSVEPTLTLNNANF